MQKLKYKYRQAFTDKKKGNAFMEPELECQAVIVHRQEEAKRLKEKKDKLF